MSSKVNSSTFRGRYRTVALLSAIWLLVALPAFSTRAQSPRPEYFGFSPAYPATLPDTVLPEVINAYVLPWESALSIDIDSAGAVTAITSDTTIDSAAFAVYRTRIAALSFRPATFEGRAVASKLSAQLVRYPSTKFFSVSLPMDTSARIGNHDLFLATIRANGIEPAVIERFPSYHSLIERGDSLAMYPYILLQLSLDSTGRVRAVEAVRSTHPAFTQHLISAANWARYTPAKVRGKAVASTNWLLVSFFPYGRYPTVPITAKKKGSLPLLAQLGIKLLSDTLGLAAPPIPRGRVATKVTVASLSKTRPGWVEAQIRVDTLGNAVLNRVGERRATLFSDLNKTLKAFRFYPALDMRGHPQAFTGFVRFLFDGSTDIRIELTWLPHAPIDTSTVTTK